jgi:hypothetical protein
VSSWAGGAAYAGVDFSTGIQNGYGGGEAYQYYSTNQGAPQQGNPQQSSVYMVSPEPAQPPQPQPQYVQTRGGQPARVVAPNNPAPRARPVQRPVPQFNAKPAAPRVATRAHRPSVQRPLWSAGRLSRALGPAMW